MTGKLAKLHVVYFRVDITLGYFSVVWLWVFSMIYSKKIWSISTYDYVFNRICLILGVYSEENISHVNISIFQYKDLRLIGESGFFLTNRFVNYTNKNGTINFGINIILNLAINKYIY